MTQRREHYQKLATAVNTLLYAKRYSEEFALATNHEGGLFAVSEHAPMDEIATELKEVLDFNVLRMELQNKTSLHPQRLHLVLKPDFTEDAFEDMIDKINAKTMPILREKYTKPVIDAVSTAEFIFDGLINPRMAETMIGELQMYLLKSVEKLELVKKAMPDRKPHAKGWRARTFPQITGNREMHDR